MSALTYGDRLRRYRQEAGLSLRALAAMVECSHVFIGEIERGYKRPTAAMMRRLSAALPSFGEGDQTRADLQDRIAKLTGWTPAQTRAAILAAEEVTP